jgi:TPR repeat protein
MRVLLLLASCASAFVERSECEGAACAQMARQIEKTDPPRSFELYTRACDGGDMGACLDPGNQYADGRGTARDDQKAAALYQKACDGGQPVGCRNLGRWYARGRAVPRDQVRARELYERGCDGGDAGSCNNLGNIFSDGAAWPSILRAPAGCTPAPATPAATWPASIWARCSRPGAAA